MPIFEYEITDGSYCVCGAGLSCSDRCSDPAARVRQASAVVTWTSTTFVRSDEYPPVRTHATGENQQCGRICSRTVVTSAKPDRGKDHFPFTAS